ncbi:MAG: hypothetical protein IJX69_05480 [Oscillospiraceae bacterium]|nr:hypothetical protein [Oscillospiraceae bacterium]
MFGYNAFANQTSSHCSAAACTSARISVNLDTAIDLVVSIFVRRIRLN